MPHLESAVHDAGQLLRNYAKAGAYVILNDDWHAPLRQRMVLLKRSAATARLFYEYMQQPAARAIFKRYGFALPGE